ncbi:MAG: hypothetical protein IPJ90_09390 [Anaerolineaceae bacterium]|nr:hypothetical protein [Anaerolineaceae bacterium]
MHLLDNAILFMFLSFVMGVIADPILRRMTNYEWWSTRYLFKDSKTYEKIGILWFQRFLKVTPLGSFNGNIHFTQKRDLATLRAIREQMATAEMSHWVGFIVMLGLTVLAWFYRGAVVGLVYVAFNVLGNVYPSLLQQYNKRRLNRVISALEKRSPQIFGTN